MIKYVDEPSYCRGTFLRLVTFAAFLAAALIGAALS